MCVLSVQFLAVSHPVDLAVYASAVAHEFGIDPALGEGSTLLRKSWSAGPRRLLITISRPQSHVLPRPAYLANTCGAGSPAVVYKQLRSARLGVS